MAMIGTKIHITGIVQGVGFRPFIYNQAIRQGLTGWVCNTSAGVEIEITGDQDVITHFIQSIKSDAPPLAQIDSIEHYQIPTQRYEKFEILKSLEISNAIQPISPDICICPDCLDELFDPQNKRYRYPFINCTNCGPRLTIIEDIPYDRPKTTMKNFAMCPDCQREYLDPTNRRFHAQPIACRNCGPNVWLEYPGKQNQKISKRIAQGDGSIQATQDLLLRGGIVAIKGLGGFHLACDATNDKAVSELRNRKLRIDKPFALMLPDIESVETHCVLSDFDRELLLSHERPIVILEKRPSSTISTNVSPNQKTLGIMLPYTPLHYLLFGPILSRNKLSKQSKSENLPPLVMTSGNISEEPIAFQNSEAINRLWGLADAFLMNDRDIRTRCDDSVLRTYRGASFPLRRSRGYAPYPVYLNSEAPQILAVGAELKNTFCITRDRYAFLSHHIGDMENAETYDSFTNGISHYESLFKIKPEAIAYDLHPNYLSTRYAVERARCDDLPSFSIQHHHAHIVSCMAENSMDSNKPVIGVAFDGTGYGEDGAIWGGEFLLADYREYKRLGHLKYIPLPGGDTSIRKPSRIALAYLWANSIDWDLEYYPVTAICAEERSILKSQLIHKINSPPTSSMGRLFDAVASIAGIRQKVNYEAQAAIEFEALADPAERGVYEIDIVREDNSGSLIYMIDPAPLLQELLSDIHKEIAISTISARFHNSIAGMVCDVCRVIRDDFSVDEVVLSGGVWQNMTLLRVTVDLLEKDGFKVHIHHKVPTNDGGLALGQAVIAIHRMKNTGS